MKKNELTKEISSGLTLSQLGKVFNCSPTTIRYYIDYYRLKLPDKVIRNVSPGKQQCAVCGSSWTGMSDSTCSVCPHIRNYVGLGDLKSLALKAPHQFYIKEDPVCIKIGVSCDSRRSYAKGFKLIYVYKTNAWVSRRLEHYLLQKYDRYPYPVKFNGYTECLYKEDLPAILEDIAEWIN